MNRYHGIDATTALKELYQIEKDGQIGRIFCNERILIDVFNSNSKYGLHDIYVDNQYIEKIKKTIDIRDKDDLIIIASLESNYSEREIIAYFIV
jgi:hypothetical protein